MLCVIDLSLILINTSCGIYSILRESKYIVVFLSVNNETQCAPILCLSSIFMINVSFFILVKLSLEKIPLNLCL